MTMDRTFINFTNHPSGKWDEAQTAAAEEYGEIIDVAFPQVDPDASEGEIEQLASDCVDRIMQFQPSAVLCQGEFTLCYNVVCKLKERGIIVLAACSRRIVEETDNRRITTFKFEQFREY